MQFLQTHYALIAALWPIVTGILTALFDAGENSPRTKAFFDLAAAIGIDAPKASDALKRIVTPPTPPAPPEVKQ